MRVEHVETESGVYTVHVDGDDAHKPFAVFLHGGPGFNSHGERNLLGGAFASEVNFLWFDQLGCGDFQQRSDIVLSWDRQVRDIAQVVRRFTDEPVHLVGHCLGGHIAHDLVRLGPGLARSVVWYAPTRSLREVLRRVLRRGVEEGRLGAAPPAELAHRLERFLDAPGEALDAADASFVLQMAGAIRDFHELYWIDRVAMSRWATWMAERPFAADVFVRLTPGLSELGLPLQSYANIPVHILYSDNDPVAPWESHGRRLLNSIPHASADLIRGAGHWIHFEKADECVRRTLEFFART